MYSTAFFHIDLHTQNSKSHFGLQPIQVSAPHPLTTPIVAMAGSSSDPAVTGPAAFAAMQEHNRPDLVSKQAAEIKDQAAKIKDQAAEIEGLKRKVEESNNALGNALDDRSEMVHKAIKLRTRMINFQSNMQPQLVHRKRVIFNAGMHVLMDSIFEIAPLEREDISEEEEEGEDGQ